MSFKEKVLKVLIEAEGREMGSASAVIRECRELIKNIPDKDENVECCMPNFEAMYHEAMEKLQKTEFVQEGMRKEIQQLHFANAHLLGFKEATELIFQKDRDCHGRC